MPEHPAATRTRRPLPARLPKHGIQVLYSEHLHGFREQWLQHDFAKLVTVDGGSGILHNAPRQQQACQRGDLLLIAPGLAHRWSDESADPMRLVIVCVDVRVLDVDLHGWLKTGVRYLPSHSEFQRQRLLRFAHQLVQEEQRRVQGWRGNIHALVQQELIMRMRSIFEGETDALMQEARRYIEAHVHEKLSIAALADYCGISYRSFTQRFKRCFAKSAQQLQRQLRIEAACDLLRSGLPIIEVALALGYADNSNFYKAFYQELQCTPGTWLQSLAS